LNLLFQAFRDALQLLISLDPDLIVIVLMTLRVTGAALFLAVILGLPVGVALGLRPRPPATALLLPLIYTGMGLPPVVVGLLVYLLLSNQGALGGLQWLFSPNAMIVAQTVLALPLVVGLSLTAVQSVDTGLRLQIRALGANRWQLAWTVLSEARLGVLAAVVAAFGRIVAEVGAVMLVGGNIEGQTRVLTTAIVLETRRGNFALALALGLILLSLAFGANATLYLLQQRRAPR
jgi:tungstate transport system permease protein